MCEPICLDILWNGKTQQAEILRNHSPWDKEILG